MDMEFELPNQTFIGGSETKLTLRLVKLPTQNQMFAFHVSRLSWLVIHATFVTYGQRCIEVDWVNRQPPDLDCQPGPLLPHIYLAGLAG